MRPYDPRLDRRYTQPRPLPNANPPIGFLIWIAISCLIALALNPVQTQPQTQDYGHTQMDGR